MKETRTYITEQMIMSPLVPFLLGAFLMIALIGGMIAAVIACIFGSPEAPTMTEFGYTGAKVAPSEIGQAVAQLALSKVGCIYSQARRYEEGCYDCSSLVERLYKEVGVTLPNLASTQGKYCYEHNMLITREELAPGDLVFKSTKVNGKFMNITHVTIYVGDGMMVHASNPRRGVVLDPLSTSHIVFYARPYEVTEERAPPVE